VQTAWTHEFINVHVKVRNKNENESRGPVVSSTGVSYCEICGFRHRLTLIKAFSGVLIPSRHTSGKPQMKH